MDMLGSDSFGDSCISVSKIKECRDMKVVNLMKLT
jgi:hypothetical protein